MTINELSRFMRVKLSPIFGEGEAKSMVNLIFHNLKGWNLTDTIINGDQDASQWLVQKCEEILRRLLTHEPIQYILNEAAFYGMNLEVNPATLIPRPETEELVDLIVDQNSDRRDLDILDIGTGSGAIAIALARNIPFSNLTAIDISPDAIETATRNARNLKTRINFEIQDIFTYAPTSKFNIIVSNPPYIDESEKKGMDRNVLDYEPHTALFVPDENPIIYYSRIIEVANTALRPSGRLYFEINPRHPHEIEKILKSENYSDIAIIKDMHGKERIISATKK